ncbi:hypothetical protein HY632_01025 [Candidatus Uhrbacteria bacterium]|nr:hypothetical protein [Candidatus Uhrbacteria bacterium]
MRRSVFTIAVLVIMGTTVHAVAGKPRAFPRLDASRAQERSDAWLLLRKLYHEDRWPECYDAGLTLYRTGRGAEKDPDVLWWIARCAHETAKVQHDANQQRETYMEARGFYQWYLQYVVQRPVNERYYVTATRTHIAELDPVIAQKETGTMPGEARGPGITITEHEGEFVIADAAGAGTHDPDGETPPIPGAPVEREAIRRFSPHAFPRDAKTGKTCQDQPLWYEDDFDTAIFVEMVALLTSDPVIRFTIVLPGKHQQMAREQLRSVVEQLRTNARFRTRHAFSIRELREMASYDRRVDTRPSREQQRWIEVRYRDVEVSPIERCRDLRPAAGFAERQASPLVVAAAPAERPPVPRPPVPTTPPIPPPVAAPPAPVERPRELPEDRSARVRAATIARAERGDVVGAIRDATLILAQYPEDAVLRAQLVVWAQYTGDCMSALTQYRLLVTTATVGFDSEAAHLAGARCAEAAGDPELRIAAYERYAEHAKFTDPEIFAVLGDAHRALADAQVPANTSTGTVDIYARAKHAYRRFLEFARRPKDAEERARVERLLAELDAIPAGSTLRVETPQERVARCLASGQAKRRLVHRGGKIQIEIELPPAHVSCD